MKMVLMIAFAYLDFVNNDNGKVQSRTGTGNTYAVSQHIERFPTEHT